MIPKIIHYCWFGRNPMPESAQKCIASWKKFLPDYEIWQWSEEPLQENEDENENRLADKVLAFDVNSIRYTKEAYEAKKYAFVSDYARFWILYRYGGLYFDTDVEVIKPMDDIIEQGPFMGCESSGATNLIVNPGVGLGITPGLGFIAEMLEKYADLHFLNEDGTINQKTIVSYTTEQLFMHGLEKKDEIQKVDGVWIYPQDYFNPLDDLTGKLRKTENTRSVHWFMNSWGSGKSLRRWLSRMSHRLFGLKLHFLLERLRGNTEIKNKNYK